MKHLVVARYGEYTEHTGHLNDDGRTQMQALAKKLRIITEGARVVILTSPVTYVRESAHALASHLGVVPDEHFALSISINQPKNEARALALVRSRGRAADCLILVTHDEYSTYLPSYVAKMEFGVTSLPLRIGKGQAWVVDYERRMLLRPEEILLQSA